MRTLFNIISLATLFLLTGCQQKSAADASLNFYIVSEEKIDGGQFVDTTNFPKLGYINPTPDLTITKLQSVAISTNNATSTDEKGRTTIIPSILISMQPDDAKKFSSLTKKAIGKQLLLELNDTPLIAPKVVMSIDDGNIQISGISQENKIENELKQLVH
jgi:preprotein translocase subunit SecD